MSLDGHIHNFLLGISLGLKLLSHGVYSDQQCLGDLFVFALFSNAIDKISFDFWK